MEGVEPAFLIEVICDGENSEEIIHEDNFHNMKFDEEEEELAEKLVEEKVVVNFEDDYEYPLGFQGEEGVYRISYINEIWNVEEEEVKKELFKCPHCSREYPCYVKLQQHLRNHRPRQHVCQYCGQKFLYRKDRITHERMHTGERPFACPECNKCFVQKCTLDTHMIQHYKQERDEFCQQCGKAYFHKKSLALHIKEKHSTTTKIRFCQTCGKEFHAYTKYIYHVGKCREEYQNGGESSKKNRRRKHTMGKLTH